MAGNEKPMPDVFYTLVLCLVFLISLLHVEQRRALINLIGYVKQPYNFTLMSEGIKTYNDKQTADDRAICNLLAQTIVDELTEAECKIWHAHPVWFLDGNPIVGYSKQKAGWRLMFWSGADFEEDALKVKGEKFKDASIFFTKSEQINTKVIKRWLKKSRDIQWDYKNIVKRKGKLERLKSNLRD